MMAVALPANAERHTRPEIAALQRMQQRRDQPHA